MLIPETTLCIKCSKDVKEDEVKGIVGIGMASHYVCQPCGENYRLAEVEFCNNYFKTKGEDAKGGDSSNTAS